ISQNYPNPFNPTTTIKFGVPKASPVTLEIYNILGEKVRTLLNGENFEPGYWTVNWDGKDNAGLSVPSGIYFYRIVAGDFVKTMKMMMLK
ncbi:MAG: T9SS type A sorting domain-containing protein, partial [Bacteroidota bacterium]